MRKKIGRFGISVRGFFTKKAYKLLDYSPLISSSDIQFEFLHLQEEKLYKINHISRFKLSKKKFKDFK